MNERKICPLMSYHREGYSLVYCEGEGCMFADKNGECLLAKALQHYINPIEAVYPLKPIQTKGKTNDDIQFYFDR